MPYETALDIDIQPLSYDSLMVAAASLERIIKPTWHIDLELDDDFTSDIEGLAR